MLFKASFCGHCTSCTSAHVKSDVIGRIPLQQILNENKRKTKDFAQQIAVTNAILSLAFADKFVLLFPVELRIYRWPLHTFSVLFASLASDGWSLFFFHAFRLRFSRVFLVFVCQPVGLCNVRLSACVQHAHIVVVVVVVFCSVLFSLGSQTL